ncbi:MAG: hypothetical protein ACYSTL_00090 [Planctomycetota bacterium]|jgi:hypothetical protein
MIGWAFLGVVIGAAGTELLRAKKPELVDSVEGAAKRVVDLFSSPESTGEDVKDKQDE